MLCFNDLAELQRGGDALREALHEYMALLRASRQSAGHAVRLSIPIIKTWRCKKCQATGEIHSSTGDAMVEAIRAQHRRKRLIEGCQFDQQAVVISPALSGPQSIQTHVTHVRAAAFAV